MIAGIEKNWNKTDNLVRSAILLCFCLFIIPLAALSGEVLFPRLQPDPDILRFTVMEEPLLLEELIRLSLVTSGVTDGKIESYQKIINSMILETEQFVKDRDGLYDRSEGLLQFLHESVLRKYDENQTRMDTLLDLGTYNCVSSTALYLILARSLDIPVSGVATKDHVFCLVSTEKGNVDVETTTVYGFNPGIKKQFTDAFGQTGFSYVPPGNYSDRWEVREKQLISYILQNRISMLQKERNYVRSAELAVDRYHLLQNAEAFQGMVKEFINVAAALNGGEAYLEGIEFLDMVKQAYTMDQELVQITDILVHNVIVTLLDKNEFDNAFQSLLGFYEQGSITEKTNKEYSVYLYGRQGESLGKDGFWLEAVEIIRKGIDHIGPDSRLLQAEKTFQRNFASVKHNEFARLFNNGSYEKAISVLEQALLHVPDSDLLKKDLKTASRVLEQQ